MNKFRFISQTFVYLFFVLAFSNIVVAQNARSWVSGVGDDANPCTRTAPCKTFAGAVNKTALYGEMMCLDAGTYGAVTITRSITIDCAKAPASINAASGSGVVVNMSDAADALKTFRLRGVSIGGAGTGANGIRILAGRNVFIEDVTVNGFAQHGISVENTDGLLKMFVQNATVHNNAGNGLNTWLIGNGSAMISASNSTFTSNDVGFNLSQTVKATLQNSIVSGNNTGIQVYSSELNVTGCQIMQNGTGIQAYTSSIIRIGENKITSNTTGLAGSQIISFGSNIVHGNGTNGAPTSTVSVL